MTVVALVAVVLLAVLGASTGASWRPGVAPLPDLLAPRATATPTEDPTDAVSDRADRVSAVEVSGELLPLAGIVLVGVVVGALLRLVMGLRGADVGRPGRAAAVEAAPPAAEPEPDVATLRRGVARAHTLLGAGAAPADGVIAAWLAVEEAAAASGVTRAPSQTSSELTAAVLAATNADPDAVRTLLALYHRARFAMGEAGRTTPADVEQARACLRRLADAWPVRG